jgi:L-iditol 2-dehydrogenase
MFEQSPRRSNVPMAHESLPNDRPDHYSPNLGVIQLTNLSAVLYGEKDLRIEERAMPEPQLGEVLVRVEAVGICGSDIHYYEHGRIDDAVVLSPMVVGHESAGVVVSVGDGIDPKRVGQRVALEPGVPDGTCEQCRIGRYNLCPNVRFFATPPVDGSIAQFITINAAFAHRAPSGITLEQAAMAEPVSVGVWANRKASVGPGDRVLVTGAGPIGLFAAQAARSYGASAVTITDVSDYRLGVARELGFDACSATEPLIDGFDVLLECSGAPAAITSGINALNRAGRAVLIGAGADTVPLPVSRIQGYELTVTGVRRYANTYPIALDLIASGKVDTSLVISHRFSLEETEQALTLGRRVPDSLKPVVAPNA